jgi:ribonuclease G
VGSDSRSGKSASQNEILINAIAGETRAAVIEQGQFTELYIERERERSVTGMVALGRVTRVLPGMQAAFVDIGLEKAAFLYVGDYLDEAGRLAELGAEEARPRRRGRNGRQPPKIETVLREGQQIVVQVAKDPIGTKGARITSHVSIAGRHLVLTPWAQRVGVSRRIDSDRERRRLRDAVSRVRPKDLGFIIRTAGEGTTEADLEADVRYLTTAWDDIQAKQAQVDAPARLHEELSLPLRVIRDMTSARTRRVVVDDAETYERMNDFLSRFVADPKPKLERYDGTAPIFDHFGIEAQIDANLGKKAWLKSGGYLVIDQSEALTAIDVNTGRFVGKQNLEETVLKTNLEAVKEVVNQLRFRNIGGLIIIDLIDMESRENREKVYRALQEALRADKAKTNILKISELGLVEMTRKRTRENLVQQLCEPCGHCEGRGYVLSAESVAYKVLREIRKDLPRFCGREIAITVHPQVAEMLIGPARKAVAALGEELGREIEVRARTGQHQEQFEVSALGEGPPVELELPWLAEHKPKEEKTSGGRSRRRGRGRRGAAAEEDEASAETAEEATPEAGEAAEETAGAEGIVAAAAAAAPALAEVDAEAEASEEVGRPEEGAEKSAETAPEPPEVPAEPDVAAAAIQGAAGVPIEAEAPEEDEGSPEGEKPDAEPEAEPVLAAAAKDDEAPELLDAEAEKPILPRPEKPEES